LCYALKGHANAFAAQTLVHIYTAQGYNCIIIGMEATTKNFIAVLDIVERPF
jgi:hypothetical protein